MIYAIISNNDIPVTQMHTYLKNETNDDGGNIPEIFNDLALSESVNGLYAFAIACLVTDNFTKQTSLFTNDEVSILNFIQYLKGMATTIQRKHKTDNKLYDNLVNTNLIGTAPTILNLDGDFTKEENALLNFIYLKITMILINIIVEKLLMLLKIHFLIG